MGLAQTQGLETQRAKKNWMFYEVFGMHTVGNTYRNTHVWIQNGLSTVGFFGAAHPSMAPVDAKQFPPGPRGRPHCALHLDVTARCA